MSDDILELPPPVAGRRITYGPGATDFGDLRLPPGAGPHPLAVVMHGGFWRQRYDLSHIGHLCAALTAAGIATWNIEYRRVGGGGGWPHTFLDVARAVDHVRLLTDEYPLDLTRVVTVGHSAGGHLALWAAGRHRIPAESPLAAAQPLTMRGAVSLAGVNDLALAWRLGLGNGIVEQFLGGAPSGVPERYAAASPPALLPLGVPQVLIHGTADTAVPFVVAEEYGQAAAAAGDVVEMVRLEGTGHFEVIDPRSAEWPSVQAAIQRVLSASITARRDSTR